MRAVLTDAEKARFEAKHRHDREPTGNAELNTLIGMIRDGLQFAGVAGIVAAAIGVLAYVMR